MDTKKEDAPVTTTHTPGPWVLDERGGCLAVYPESRRDDKPGMMRTDDRNIHFSDKGSAYDGTCWTMDQKAVANARLIAAAPDLLEALKEAHHQLHSLLAVFVPDTDGAHATTADVMAQARAAIAKAEGRTDG